MVSDGMKEFSKFLLMLLLSVACINSKAQEQWQWIRNQKKSPFKVIYTEQAFQNGSPLSTGHLISKRDLIENRSGILVLLHISGQIFHFSNDTLFYSGDLLNKEKRQKKSKYAPDVSFLFDTTKVIRIDPYSIMYMVPPPTYQLIYPFGDVTETDRNQGICLWWRSHYPDHELPQQFLVKMVSIFDESLRDYIVDTTMVHLPIPGKVHLPIIIQLSNLEETEFAEDSGIYIRKVAPTKSPCTAKNSKDFFHIAMALEKNDHFDESLSFYRKAALNSNQGFYHLIYKFARIRLSQN